MNKASRMHLFHGGHKGTESRFGAAAEKWDISETTLSYDGQGSVQTFSEDLSMGTGTFGSADPFVFTAERVK